MADKKAVEVPNFEQSLGRLEALVREMEGGKLSLEQMMAHFEEGSGLVKVCSAKLNEVEKKIEVLVRKGDAFATEPLDPKALRDDAG
jgi:exodeoxyribonuclease VII small subunit